MEEMSPPAIVEEAVRKGLHMIAICDHNAAGNTASMQEAAGTAIAAVAGMEVTTVEDIHVVGLFPDAAKACSAAETVRANLPPLSERAKRFGQQLLMDAKGRVVGTESKMLAASSALTLSETVNLIKRHDGLAIAAHVNRPSFSVMSQLGLFPPDVGFDAVEIFLKPNAVPPFGSEHFHGLSVVSSSDSHFLFEIGRCATILEVAEPTFDELVQAIKGIGGRRCCCA
jgi:PHP family Zn ribbon phosphoesterase